ncbi:hypothetical protein JQ620_15780 [Bradyrhizobium sp. AUGA SZCCT0274]|uniref:hypothetical protein n=1 Tax=Bradyrhizobium sp. AUGA SZCCT0274 TaxID=2807670 RepID=UPI001BAC7A2E|nr:hypothetical protein [Bradyrhizobium sp. AUGA SZCCT0274]MBR1241589.1 hypothetical protein [Bradyrhizobium sp. AUGA SZCCT0274]
MIATETASGMLTLNEAIIECVILVENTIGRDLIGDERHMLAEAINGWVKRRAITAALH